MALFRGGYGEFLAGGFDLGIACRDAYRRPRPEGIEAVLLRREALCPVCAPALLRGPAPLRGPADLAGTSCCTRRATGGTGGSGCGRPAWRSCRPAPGRCSTRWRWRPAPPAAGLGVAITDLHLFRDELEAGRLVAPFGLVVSEDTGYLLFAERGRFAEPGIATFRDWLLAEVAAEGGA